RATLLLRDRARLARLVSNPERPVLLLFAGKAHPADEPGKYVLREIRQLMMSQEFMGRIIFLEDYDLQLARSLVSGVDVWLNNPIAPLEASGTSGIKAAINGRLNLSILDGWWAEGWMQDNGWGIPPANVQDPERRDALEAELILATLEEEGVPLYYTRSRVAQQPDCAARGERQLRHQGGHQRAPQPEHPRRLVGGGLDAGQRLGHTAGQRSGSRAARCARGRADPRHARGGGGAALLHPRRERLPGGVGSAQQARHDDRDPGIQHAPRAVRLHPGAVPAGGGAAPAPHGRRLRRRPHARRLEDPRAAGLAQGEPPAPHRCDTRSAARRAAAAARGARAERA